MTDAEKIKKRQRWLKYVSLARALFWVVAAPVILLTSLKNQIWIVILLSLYANFAADFAGFIAADDGEEKMERAS